MRTIRFAISMVAAALTCGANGAHAGPAPLSCNMQMLLNGMTAMQRDQGVSRKDAKIANTPDTDLTKQEIKTVLDRIYVKGKNQTPDQIKNDVYRRCESGQ